MPKPKGFIVVTKHNSSADPHLAYRETYDECVNIVHEHFLSYDCEIKDGRAYDPDNDDGKDGGFKCLSNVKMHNGKVAQYTHADGDGPVAFIEESE
jgi:hypothetical protein